MRYVRCLAWGSGIYQVSTKGGLFIIIIIIVIIIITYPTDSY